MSDTHQELSADIHESIARHEVGREWSGVPLAAEAPAPGAGLVIVVEVPDDVVRPFEVADGRYVIPAGVIRPYPAVTTRR